MEQGMAMDTKTFVMAAALAAAGGLADAQEYKFTPLSFPGGASLSVNAHNNREQAVGSAYDQDGVEQAVVWQKGVPTVLPGLGLSSSALAINRRGQVVGNSSDPIRGEQAVLWDDAGVTILEATDGAGAMEAVGINASGTVVGNAAPYRGGPSHAVKWVDGKPVLLDSLGGTSVAQGINQAGDVVGYVDGPDGFNARKPVVWHGTVATVLEPLYETPCCDRASAISDSGEIVGWSSSAGGGDVRAVLWTGTKPTALQALSVADNAIAINDQHQAVGVLNAGGVTHAALWNLTTGEGVDLNTFLTAEERAQGWELSTASGINRKGVIVGTAYNSNTGSFSGFQLTPRSKP
jgi:uncharacterized membrane protein